jgi:hypothetical protein
MHIRLPAGVEFDFNLPPNDSAFWPIFRIFMVMAFSTIFMWDTATQFDETELNCLARIMTAVCGLEVGIAIARKKR